MKGALHLVISVIIVLGLSSSLTASDAINKNVDRTIDLTTQLVKISTSIMVENAAKQPMQFYYYVVDPNHVGNMSFIGAKDNKKNVLATVSASNANQQIYKISLKRALNTGEREELVIQTVYTRAQHPHPTAIRQRERQLMRYFGNHYAYSQYTTEKQKTKVMLNSRNVESYSKLNPVTQMDSQITYGPYENVGPLAYDPMTIHYENNAPFMTVQSLKRLVEVSHWGNIAVEEQIDIKHTGAELKGPFSRYDYQREARPIYHSVKSYKTILPPSAQDIYYRDSNGNISTSQVKSRKDWTEVELFPRFPLFGGWKTSYIIGYNVPSHLNLFQKGRNQYQLSVKLLDHIFDDMFVEFVDTRIVLPVGVSQVRIEVPYAVEQLPNEVAYKYLDYIGRTVIRLQKTDLVEQHIQELRILYTWNPIVFLHEPLLIAGLLYFLFILVIIYMRLDFSIRVNEQQHLKKE